jgi:hypothetical protein
MDISMVGDMGPAVLEDSRGSRVDLGLPEDLHAGCLCRQVEAADTTEERPDGQHSITRASVRTQRGSSSRFEA